MAATLPVTPTKTLAESLLSLALFAMTKVKVEGSKFKTDVPWRTPRMRIVELSSRTSTIDEGGAAQVNLHHNSHIIISRDHGM